MNQTIKELFERKSVRVFEDKPIEKEKKELILKSAIQAPTAGNMCLYSILDITDQAVKDKLSVTCDNQPFIAKAPLVLVFLADYARWHTTFKQVEDEVRKPGSGDLLLAASDALIAAQNAVVAAESLGIGSCYIGDILERYEIHKELFKLPKHAVPIGMVVFGYPTKQQQEREKPNRYEVEDLVYENFYDNSKPEKHIDMIAKRNNKEGEELTNFLKAFCKRKWNSEFSEEMSRSSDEIIKDWNK